MLIWKQRNDDGKSQLIDEIKEKMGKCAEEVLKYIPNSIDNEINDYIKKSDFYDVFEEGCKWYEHETDCLNLSRNFPTVLFTLYGDGENKGDIWLKYFYNGKVQTEKAIITFDPPNEKILGF